MIINSKPTNTSNMKSLHAIPPSKLTSLFITRIRISSSDLSCASTVQEGLPCEGPLPAPRRKELLYGGHPWRLHGDCPRSSQPRPTLDQRYPLSHCSGKACRRVTRTPRVERDHEKYRTSEYGRTRLYPVSDKLVKPNNIGSDILDDPLCPL